jgi:mono/diheme cytochrome c family protein
MKISYKTSIIAAIMAIILPGIAQTQEFGDVTKGHEFAVRACASCHAVDRKDILSPDPNAPPFKAVADMPSTTHMAVAAWLQLPHPTMPNLILSVEERDDVIAYILALKDGP